MTFQRPLILPDTFEELTSELGNELTKMTQFVVPVEEAEKNLAVITQAIKHSGKIVFLLGNPGIGKSTFIQSLTWRKFLPIPSLHEINADELGASRVRLETLYQEIAQLSSQPQAGERGLLTVVINYFENFSGIDDDSIKGFFRDINGLLRRKPILIIWPTTQKNEVDRILDIASSVSSTVFTDNPVLSFNGPPIDKFPTIAKSTVATLNPGLSFDDFQLSDEDLDAILLNLKQLHKAEQIIRNYLRMVKQEWTQRSGEIEQLIAKIPRFTEVWFMLCYPGAEDVVSQFARRSTDPDLAWDSDTKKFSEYIRTGQKAAEWNQKRLMYALQGFFKVKILYLPTQALVSCVTVYGQDVANRKYKGKVPESLSKLITELHNTIPNKHWRQKSQAIRFLMTSPLLYQIQGKEPPYGQRRGKSSTSDDATAAFMHINRYISAAGGDGSDQIINECLGLGIKESLNLDKDQVIIERGHPWLGSIRPDIMINTNPNKIVCLEMHYTSDQRPFILANYVLDKMRVYMRQIEAYMDSPRLFSDF